MGNTPSASAKMIAAMAIFGTLAPFVRQTGLPSGELALYRALIAVAVIGLYLALRGERVAWRQLKGELPLLAVSGAAMGVNWILLFQAYRYTTVSIATLSYYFAPVIVMIACPLLFRERMTRRQVACFALSTLGLVLVIGLGGPAAEQDHLRGILFGLGAAVFYAAVILMNKGLRQTATLGLVLVIGLGGPAAEQDHLRGILFGLGAAVFYAAVILMNKGLRQTAGLPRTVLQMLAAIVVLTPYVACTGGFHPELLDGTGWVCLLIVGLVHTGLAYCLYFSALKDLQGQRTAILSYVDPLVAVAVSVLVLGEGIGPWQLLGGGLILGCTLWNELGTAGAKNSRRGY